MDKLRLGVIGVGSVVREIYEHLYYSSQYSDMIDVVAIADPYEKGLNAFGRAHDIPKKRRYRTHSELIQEADVDAVMVNTPDHLHAAPAIEALEKGLDVLVPKPAADNITDCHAMIEAAKSAGRLLTIDFHKREDPRILEAAARYQEGRYGKLQSSTWYMVDKLMVADPNHKPRFFAMPDFAAKNTPVSFLTVHMCDALMNIVKMRPASVRAIGFKQKLPSLRPIPVNGYDLVDTEILFEEGAVSHIVTGWAIPNTAHAVTVQSARMICTDGLIDLKLDTAGFQEMHAEGIIERNTLFRNFGPDGIVTGYGMTSPGNLLRRTLQYRDGTLPKRAYNQLMQPDMLGFYTTMVLQGAHESLDSGTQPKKGVFVGKPVDLKKLVRREIGGAAARKYLGK